MIALSLVTKSIQAGAVNVIVYSYCNFLEERQINTSLKHGYQLDPVTSINLLNGDHRYYIDKAWDKDLTTGDYSFKDNPIPEYYALNSDYNVSKKQQYNSTLPIQFNYCSDCINVFPYRIIWSPKSFDEESFDLYRGI